MQPIDHTSPSQPEPTGDALTVLQVVAAGTGGRYTPESLPGDALLKDIGIDSLKFIVMVLELETKLKRKVFNAENLGRTRTLDDLLGVALAPRS